jgi:DNA-binding FrmR family transcriptional regulator
VQQQPEAGVEHAGGDRDRQQVVDLGPEQVLLDGAPHPAGKADRGGHRRGVLFDQNDAGGLHGRVGARADGDADVGQVDHTARVRSRCTPCTPDSAASRASSSACSVPHQRVRNASRSTRRGLVGLDITSSPKLHSRCALGEVAADTLGRYPGGVWFVSSGCPGRRAMASYTDRKDDYLTRLRRIEGQLRGLQRMVEQDKYCIDVLTQVGAATKALQAFSLELLEEHLATCVVEAAKAGDGQAQAKVREASDAIARLVRS